MALENSKLNRDYRNQGTFSKPQNIDKVNNSVSFINKIRKSLLFKKLNELRIFIFITLPQFVFNGAKNISKKIHELVSQALGCHKNSTKCNSKSQDTGKAKETKEYEAIKKNMSSNENQKVLESPNDSSLEGLDSQAQTEDTDISLSAKYNDYSEKFDSKSQGAEQTQNIALSTEDHKVSESSNNSSLENLDSKTKIESGHAILTKLSVDELFQKIAIAITEQNDLSDQEIASRPYEKGEVLIYIDELGKKIDAMGKDINIEEDELGNTIAHRFASLTNIAQKIKCRDLLDMMADKLHNVSFYTRNNLNFYPIDYVMPCKMTPLIADLFMNDTPQDIIHEIRLGVSNPNNRTFDRGTFLESLMHDPSLRTEDMECIRPTYRKITSHNKFNPYAKLSDLSSISILSLSAGTPSANYKAKPWLYAFEGFLDRENLNINHDHEGKTLPIIILQGIEKILNMSEDDAALNSIESEHLLLCQLQKINMFIHHCQKFNKKINSDAMQKLKKIDLGGTSKLNNKMAKVKSFLIEKLPKEKLDEIKSSQNSFNDLAIEIILKYYEDFIKTDDSKKDSDETQEIRQKLDLLNTYYQTMNTIGTLLNFEKN